MSRPETSAHGEQHEAAVQNDQDIICCGANCGDEKPSVAAGGHEDSASLRQLYPFARSYFLEPATGRVRESNELLPPATFTFLNLSP